MVKWGLLGRWMRCLFRISVLAEAGNDWIWTNLILFMRTDPPLGYDVTHRFPAILRSITWLRTKDLSQQNQKPHCDGSLQTTHQHYG